MVVKRRIREWRDYLQPLKEGQEVLVKQVTSVMLPHTEMCSLVHVQSHYKKRTLSEYQRI